MKKHLLALVLCACCFSLFFSSCSKQMTPDESQEMTKIESTANPNLLPGKCPYPCTDTRCKAYLNGYCGTPPPPPPPDTTIALVQSADSNATTANILSSAFNSLAVSVDFTELGSVMGTTINASAIDFNGGLLAYDRNNQSVFNQALGANFYQNNGTTLYAFVWLADSANYLWGNPFMVKVNKGVTITLYDLVNGYIYTINNYASARYSITETQGSYIISGGQVAMGRVIPAVAGGGCTGKNVNNCIVDAYANHGWASAWLTVQTAFLPMTAAVLAGSCVAINCIPHKD
jgi:hypothetical protein